MPPGASQAMVSAAATQDKAAESSAKAASSPRPTPGSLLEEEEEKVRVSQSCPVFKSKQLTENAKIAKVLKACRSHTHALSSLVDA